MRASVALAIALACAACGSRGGVKSPGRATPVLFASIPVDTPYLIAGFEPIPFEAFATMWRAVEPMFGETLEPLLRDGGASVEDRVIEAIVRELDGKWSVAGLESLGLSARPRFALYGLGYQPTVLRVEIKDVATVLATIGRIATRADVKLPPTENHDGRSYWRIPTGDRDLVVALLDQQLIAAYGARSDLDRSLSLILGSKKPERSMAEDTVLADVMKRHRFDPYAIGIIDTKRLSTAFLAHRGITVTPACSSEIDRMAARVPRFVGAYNIAKARHGMVMAVELAPELVAKLGALKVSVPGLSAALAKRPFATFGGGIDLPAAQDVGLAVGGAVEQLGAACGWTKLREAGDGFAAQMRRAVPAPFEVIRGGFISMITMSHEEPIPLTLEGYGVISVTSTQPLLDLMAAIEVTAKLGILGDGAWHAFGDKLPLKMPWELSAAIGKRSLAIAAGTRGKDLAMPALDAPASDKSPFLISRYDYGRWLELKSRRAVSLEADMQRSLARVFGDVEMILDVDPAGLRFDFNYDLK